MRRLASTTLIVLLLLAIWQGLISFFALPAYLVPTPGAVLAAAVERRDVLAGHTALTVGAAIVGLLISTLFASAFALLFTVSRHASQTAMPVLLVFRSAPVAAVAPLITLFMGRGIGTSVVVVTIVSFFPLMINLQRGLAAADRSAIELLHVYGAGLWKQMAIVRIPYAMPYFFTGLRIAGASAVLGTMLSEWITGARGLGKLILDSGEMRETGMLWAAVLTSVLIGLLVFALTSWGESYATRWRQAGASLKE
jgi:ABC-type nitrate/sulfonate/bicarbonate transport system permease component